MKGNRSGQILLAGGAVVFIFLLLLVLRPREPVYQGRTLAAWLEYRDRSFGRRPGAPFPTESVAKVEDAVRHMGAAAVPSLRKMLRTRDSRLRQRIVAFCSKRPWMPVRFRLPSQTLQRWGLFGIHTLGPVGEAGIPELVDLTRSPEWTIRGSAAGALGRIGLPARATAPELIALCGIPSNLAEWGSCAKVTPSSALMAFSPSVPSEPVPDKMTPMVRWR